MQSRQFIAGLCACSLFLSGCAASSSSISAQYVSPLTYQHYNCRQIRQEMERVSRRVNEVAGVQDAQRSKDSVALGVGLVLFWPALFFMIGKDKKEELGRLKGEYEALEQAAIQKECSSVIQELEAARRAAAEQDNKADGKETSSAVNK